MDDGRASADSDGIVEFFGRPQPLPALRPDPKMFSWDVPDRHAGGMCDDAAFAAGCVHDELMGALAGMSGTIRTTTPSAYDGLVSLWTATRTETGVSWVYDRVPVEL